VRNLIIALSLSLSLWYAIVVMHDLTLIHTDLKLENILLESSDCDIVGVCTVPEDDSAYHSPY
jgi:serine/threonine protein kinase